MEKLLAIQRKKTATMTKRFQNQSEEWQALKEHQKLQTDKEKNDEEWLRQLEEAKDLDIDVKVELPVIEEQDLTEKIEREIAAKDQEEQAIFDKIVEEAMAPAGSAASPGKNNMDIDAMARVFEEEAKRRGEELQKQAKELELLEKEE